jgi:hypothetical protein
MNRYENVQVEAVKLGMADLEKTGYNQRWNTGAELDPVGRLLNGSGLWVRWRRIVPKPHGTPGERAPIVWK